MKRFAMKRIAMKMILGLPLAVLVQVQLVQVQNVQAQENAKTGEAIFAQSCSSGYCHGSKGAGSGAPRLSGRGFDQAIVLNCLKYGRQYRHWHAKPAGDFVCRNDIQRL